MKKGEFVKRLPLFSAFAGEKKEDGSTRKYDKYNMPDDIDLSVLPGVYYLYFGDALQYVGVGTDKDNGVMQTIRRHFQTWNDTLRSNDRVTFNPSSMVSYEVQTFPNTEKGREDAVNFEVLEIARLTPPNNYIGNPFFERHRITTEDVADIVAEAIMDGRETPQTEEILEVANEEFLNVTKKQLEKTEKELAEQQAFDASDIGKETAAARKKDEEEAKRREEKIKRIHDAVDDVF